MEKMEVFINFWAVVGILILSSFAGSVTGAGDTDGVSAGPARFSTYSGDEGGEWIDDFGDGTMVDRTSGVDLGPDGYAIRDQNETVDFLEDFESYSNGQDLFGVNGWIADTNRSLSSSAHQFTATASGPPSSASPTKGKIYNPSDKYSFILSGKMNVASGILTCWFATDLVSASGASGMISLMKSQSATPSNDDRVVGLIVRNNAIAYRTTATSSSTDIIPSGIMSDTWYRFEIRFDCATDKASIYIFDVDGKLLGFVEDIDFISPAASIGRVELFTNRDISGGYVTTYWDDIRITPETGQMYRYGAKFAEDFESYSNGQNLFGVNGWIADTSRGLSSSLHQFTATTSGPPSSVSLTFGKIYNPDDKYSYILSQRMDITSGILTCWYATDSVDARDSSGMISLMKSTSPTPSHDDRVLGLLIRDGGVNYRTTPTSSSRVIVSSGITANTWYRFEVHFNCTTDKASIYIYQRNGDLLGAASEIDLISDADHVGRIELFTNRDVSGHYVTNYWDNIEIWGLTEEKSVTSKVVELPPGMKWTSLAVEKVETQNSGISVSVLDENDLHIPGFIYDDTESEIDISPLNAIGVNKIKLRGDLTGTVNDSPVLEGWGVEWDGPDSWRDSYLTSLRTSSMTGTEIDMGEIALVHGQNSGTMITEAIDLPANHYWTEMKAELRTGTGYTVQLDILDAATDSEIPGMTGFTGNGFLSFDVSPIDPLIFKQVRIRASFTSTGGEVPVMGSLSISWKLNTDPFIGNMTVDPYLFRTESTVVSFDVGDVDQGPETLSVSLEYRSDPESSWENTMLTDPSYNDTTGEWESLFSTDRDTSVGNYSFRLTVTDRLDVSVFTIFRNRTLVRNNIPTVPVIELRPGEPNTQDEIEAVLVSNGTDVETDNLLYDYLWYVNGNIVVQACRYNLTADQVSALSPDYTRKHDTVSCSVRSFDGLDHSVFYDTTISIVNSEPVVLNDWPSVITLYEDTSDSSLNLSRHLIDPDGDEFDFSCSGNEEIDVGIQSNGTVIITSPGNWSGSENVTFVISDFESSIERNVTITVLPVNDKPEFVSFTSDRDSGFTSENFEFHIEAIDIDTEELRYIWMINDQVIDRDLDTVDLNWTLDYWTEAEWKSKKNSKDVNVSVIVSDGEFEIGPFYHVVTVNLRDYEIYNQPPIINEIRASSMEIYEDGYVVIEINVTDPDGDELTVFWTNNLNPGFNVSGVLINVSGLRVGNNIFNVTVMDGRFTVKDSITISVLEMPSANKDKSKTGTFLIIAGIVVFLLVLILVIVFLFVSRRKKESAEIPEKETIPGEGIEEGPVASGSLGGPSEVQSPGQVSAAQQLPPTGTQQNLLPSPDRMSGEAPIQQLWQSPPRQLPVTIVQQSTAVQQGAPVSKPPRQQLQPGAQQPVPTAVREQPSEPPVQQPPVQREPPMTPPQQQPVPPTVQQPPVQQEPPVTQPPHPEEPSESPVQQPPAVRQEPPVTQPPHPEEQQPDV